MAGFIGLVVRSAMPLFKSMQAKIDRVNQVTREVLSGIRVIRAFDRTRYEEERFAVANDDLTGTTLKVNRLFALMLPTLILILNLATVAIMWFGGIQIADHGMPIGDLTAFLTYIVQILLAVLMATIMFVMVPRAAASAERIQEVLETAPTIVDPEAPARTYRCRGASSSATSSSATPAPRNPCSAASASPREPGETVAIVGSTGCGKSHPHQPHPALLRRDRRHCARRRRRRAPHAARGPLAKDRPGAAEVLPLQRHGGEQPAPRRRPGR